MCVACPLASSDIPSAPRRHDCPALQAHPSAFTAPQLPCPQPSEGNSLPEEELGRSTTYFEGIANSMGECEEVCSEQSIMMREVSA